MQSIQHGILHLVDEEVEEMFFEDTSSKEEEEDDDDSEMAIAMIYNREVHTPFQDDLIAHLRALHSTSLLCFHLDYYFILHPFVCWNLNNINCKL